MGREQEEMLLTEDHILQERELVDQIKASNPGEPMTGDNFMEWLKNFSDQ